MSDFPDLLTNAVRKETLDAIMHGRKSLYPKHYTGEQIDDKVILQILEYAHTAPNHKKTQPWRFIVYKDKALNDFIDFTKDFYLNSTPKEKITQKKLDAFAERKEKVSHVIALIVVRDELKRLPEVEEIAAVSCAVENIYLSLNTFNLGGYWNTSSIMFSDDIKEYLELKQDEFSLGFFFLGKVNENTINSKRDSVESKITWKK